MSKSPIVLGATNWWRCDSGLTLDGSSWVQAWTDVIGGKILAQSGAGGRPGLTSGRYTTTAVNFGRTGSTGLYASTNTLGNPDSGANWKWIQDGTEKYHIFICGRSSGGATGYRTVFSTLANGASSYNGWTFSAYRNTIRSYMNFWINGTQQAAFGAINFDTSASPGSLMEFRGNPGVGSDIYLVSNAVGIQEVAVTTFSSASYGIFLLGASAGGASQTTYVQYVENWGGYIEDVVIFRGVNLSGQDLTDLRDYFKELRGVPTGILPLAGNGTTSYTPSATSQLTSSLSGNTTTSYSPSGSPKFNLALGGNANPSITTNGAVVLPYNISSNTGFSLETNVFPNIIFNINDEIDTNFTTNGYVSGKVISSGNTGVAFNPDSSLGKVQLVEGDTGVAFQVVGNDSPIRPIAGDTGFNFDTNGNIDFVTKGVTGNVYTGANPSATLVWSNVIDNATIGYGLNTNASLSMGINLSRSTGLDVSPNNANLTILTGTLAGNATSSLSPTASMSGNFNLKSDLLTNIDTSGLASLIFKETANTSVTIETTGNLEPSSEYLLSSIPSAEQFGSISFNRTEYLNSLVNTTYFGIIKANFITYLSSIPSGEVFGTIKIVDSKLLPSIPSEEAFGSISYKELYHLNSIASAEAMGNISIVAEKPIQVLDIKLGKFSGELKDPLLNNSNGNVFFSPSFTSPNPVNAIEIESVESSVSSGELYTSLRVNEAPNQRPLVLGPSAPTGRVYPPDFKTTYPSYMPVFNRNFTFMGTKKNNVVGILHDTITLTDTIIFY